MTAVKPNSQRKDYLKTLPERDLDPMKRVEALIATIATCTMNNEAYYGDSDFEFAREATISLIQRASRLHSLPIWGEVELIFSKHSVHTSVNDADWTGKMSKHIEILRDTQCSFRDIERAVEAVQKCISHLNERFVRCRVPKDGLTTRGIIERYKLAAMLPRIHALLAERQWHRRNRTFNYG
jgi:hypothetical protein